MLIMVPLCPFFKLTANAAQIQCNQEFDISYPTVHCFFSFNFTLIRNGMNLVNIVDARLTTI